MNVFGYDDGGGGSYGLSDSQAAQSLVKAQQLAALERTRFLLKQDLSGAKVATTSVNILDPLVNQQPDTADTAGNTPLTTLENTAVNAGGTLAAIALTRIAPNGRYQFDANNQNFRALPQVTGVNAFLNNVGGGGIGTLLLIAFILWLMFRPSRGQS